MSKKIYDMWFMDEYERWDNYNPNILEKFIEHLNECLEKMDEGYVVKMRNEYDRRKKNEMTRHDIGNRISKIQKSLDKHNLVGCESIETYKNFRHEYKDEKTGFVFPNQDMLNCDIRLKWNIPIPIKRLEKGLGIDGIYEGLEDSDNRWELENHIEHLMYEGLSKYVIPSDTKLEKKMMKFVSLYIEIFEESLVYNENYQNFIKENIESLKEQLLEKESEVCND